MKMKNRNKKLYIKKMCLYMLTLVFMAGGVPAHCTPVFAEEGGALSPDEIGEREKIYIGTEEDFIAFASDCYIDSWSGNKDVELLKDLDFTGRDFVPVPVFDGHFAGNGHTISGISYEGGGYVTAVFRYVEENGVIDDLTVKADISASDEQECVGGIAGSNYGTIKNCTFIGNVNGKRIIGGIAAFNKSTGIIRRCTVRGRITGSYYTGGIAGISHGIITGCKNTAGLNNDSSWVEAEDEMGSDLIGSFTGSVDVGSIRSGVDTGGICGFSDGIIANCSNAGQIGYEHVGYNVGGIAGRQSGIVSLCTNSGRIYGRKDVGGIVGQMEPYIEVLEAETIKKSVDELHDLVDVLLDDLTGSKNALHDDLSGLQVNVDKAVDTGHLMADEVYSFADTNFDQLGMIVERFDYISDSLPAVFDSLSAASDSINSMGNEIKKLKDDLDVSGQLDANSGDRGRYNEAVDKIDSAMERFNDAVKSGSWQEVEDILKDENGEYKDFSGLDDEERKEIIEDVISIMENAEDMSDAAGDIMDGLDTMADILKPYIDNASDAAGRDIDSAVGELQNAVNHTSNAIDGLKGIFTYLNAQSDIRFSRLSDDYSTHREELYQEIKSISAGLYKLGDDASAYSDVVNGDLKALNDKLSEIINLILDKVDAYTTFDKDELYEDVSEEVLDAETTGRVEGCSNLGDVSADINVGGIAGSMAVDSEELEDNAAGRTEVTLGNRYLTKCVINNCRNDGYIKAKKDGAGGIAGYMKLGIIRESKSLGGVESTAGGYAGGICGESLSMIVESYALCSVKAEKYVGGIAGYGNIIRDCCAMVNLEAEAGRTGAIAGWTTAYDDEEEENGDKVSGNFYVDNGVHGMDGISYVGVAEPITYEELLHMEGLPAGFGRLKATFRVDDVYVGLQELGYGEALSELEFPDAPRKDGYYVEWPDLSGQYMTGNIVVNGEYKKNVSSLSSVETDDAGRAYAFVSDAFTEDTTLRVSVSLLEPPAEAEGRDYIVYELSLDNISVDTSEELKVRLFNPYNKMKLYRMEDGVWTEVEYSTRGSYAEAVMGRTGAVFCLVDEAAKPVLYILTGAAAVFLLVCIVIIKAVKNKKRKAGSREAKEDEGEA